MVTRPTAVVAATGTAATARRAQTERRSQRGQAALGRATVGWSRRGIAAWQPRAACKGLPQEIFFPPDDARGSNLRRREDDAKRICHSCPVIEPCLGHALDVGEQHGVWGATTPTERRRLNKIRANARALVTVGTPSAQPERSHRA